MGRTNPTYRDVVAALERDWGDYRRALRRRDRPHFDRLFEYARDHADAAGYLNHEDPTIALLVSVALAQERQRAALAERVAHLETALDERALDAADATTTRDPTAGPATSDETDRTGDHRPE